LLDIQRKQEALEVIDGALKHADNNPILWARRGQVLRRLKQFEDAVASYEKALNLDPSYAWAWNGCGLCYSAMGNWEQAKVCYQTAIECDDSDVWFWHNYGDAFFRLEDYDEAEAAFVRALEVNPKHKPTIEKLDDLRNRLR